MESALSDWQPIETVPMDQWVLVYGDPYSTDGPRFGISMAQVETSEWWERVSPTQQELRSRSEVIWEGGEVFATHWMPLPTPPK